jgi:hypothetical protein
MHGDPIPESDHVARYVSPSKYTNKVLDWNALLPRPQDRGEASYNWLEYFGTGSPQELIARLKAVITTIRIKKTGTFAFFKVGIALEGMLVAQPLIHLTFIHTPQPGNDSHCSMFGVDEANEAAGMFLNELCEEFLPDK